MHWRVTRIEESATGRVGTLGLPQLAFLPVRSDQRPAPVLYAARIELDKTASGDILVELADGTRIDPEPVGCAYAVVATGDLAAAVETNTSYDEPTGTKGATWENGRFWRQTVSDRKAVVARLTCGRWTYRAATAGPEQTEPLPQVTVVVTRDRNGDGVADWQDAAIAMRDIMVEPRGADEQHLRVVPHIPFNFASQATNPFLTTLDHVKRIHLATDGLRQARPAWRPANAATTSSSSRRAAPPPSASARPGCGRAATPPRSRCRWAPRRATGAAPRSPSAPPTVSPRRTGPHPPPPPTTSRPTSSTAPASSG